MLTTCTPLNYLGLLLNIFTNYIKKIIDTISANPPAPTNTPKPRTAGF